jgi:hypothetical protein
VDLRRARLAGLAVLVSSSLTPGGYWQLVHPWGAQLLTGWHAPAGNAPYVAGGLIILAALLVDIFPYFWRLAFEGRI